MILEVDEDCAREVVGNMIIQDYINLRDYGFYEDTGDYNELLSAYLKIIDYCTTQDQRKLQGLVE